MNLKSKYKDDYEILAGLRQFVEQGTILASVNWWRDNVQSVGELETIEKRAQLIHSHWKYEQNPFLVAFVKEEFPVIDEAISPNVIEIGLSIIEKNEDAETLMITKEFLLDYAIAIAKSSKEDWLSFIGLKDNISNKEEAFISELSNLLGIIK